jgi:hypothetical protein
VGERAEEEREKRKKSEMERRVEGWEGERRGG